MGDKVSSPHRRRGGRRRGRARHAPSSSPSADEVVAFGERVRLAGRHQGRLRRRRPRHARRADAADEAAGALESAQREALKGFGRDECYVERYLTWPRHIEMQVFADTHGNCVWLGERDCSAPAPPPEADRGEPGARASPTRSRQAMGEAAVKVAKACGYVNAGTVEFLLPGRRVLLPRDEHPPPGRAPRHRAGDRPRPRRAEQMRVAVGRAAVVHARTTSTRARPRHRGAASTPRTRPAARSCRRPGTITELPPARRASASAWDGGYEAGDEVSQYYDNLVGKLIVWGRDRDARIAAHAAGARRDRDRGHRHHDPRRPRHPRAPRLRRPPTHSTKWVEETLDLSGVDGAGRAGAPTRRRATSRKVAARRRRRGQRPALHGDGVGARRRAVAAAGGAGGAARAAPGPARAAGGAGGGGAGSGKVTVPMQGTIVKVLVAVGDAVEVGQAVCVLEAMKMENNITAEKAGTVAEVKVDAGDTVGAGDIVVVIDALTAQPATGGRRSTRRRRPAPRPARGARAGSRRCR